MPAGHSQGASRGCVCRVHVEPPCSAVDSTSRTSSLCSRCPEAEGLRGSHLHVQCLPTKRTASGCPPAVRRAQSLPPGSAMSPAVHTVSGCVPAVGGVVLFSRHVQAVTHARGAHKRFRGSLEGTLSVRTRERVNQFIWATDSTVRGG